MNRVFVTGTDTGIGKTVVATLLSVGLKARYWKPVQTGAKEGIDTDFVRRWHADIWPETYCFAEPQSPHYAAELEGRAIDVVRIVDACPQGPLIIEGAGGALVPLTASVLMADLMAALKLPAVVVTSGRLGTINHTLLTIEALRRRKVDVAGLIVVGEIDPKVQSSLTFFGDTRVLGHVKRTPNFSAQWFVESFSQLRWEE